MKKKAAEEESETVSDFLHMRIHPELKKRLKKFAHTKEMNISEYVMWLIRDALEKGKK